MKTLSAVQHEHPTFFIDRCLGQKSIANKLREIGEKVEIHDDHFPDTYDDMTWLKATSKRGWVVLTKDKNINYKPNEISMLLNTNSRVFILHTRVSLKKSEMVSIFTRYLPEIKEIIKITKRPYVFKISKNAKVDRYM